MRNWILISASLVLFVGLHASAQPAPPAPLAPPPAVPAPAALPPGADPTLYGLLNAGDSAKQLARACQTPAHADTIGCLELVKVCSTPTYKDTVACKTAPAAAVVEVNPQPIANPNALPPKVKEAIENCRDELDCKTMADFRRKYEKPGYMELAAWCLDRVLSGNPESFSATGLRRATRVCEAVANDANGGNGLQNVNYVALTGLLEEVSKTGLDCSGFGLTLPFLRIRRPGNGTVDVSGPVSAGVGGGYYHAFTCDERSTLGMNMFAYSEGLDLTKGTAQFGVGVSVGATAFKVFRFGVGLGYDLFRLSSDGDGNKTYNGLLVGRSLGAPSISYMITLDVHLSGSDKAEGKESTDKDKEK
ncbi:hypothetical protein [Archangium sp.]|jgi:hypothetical protein|uniref:hypothetical protein n=1 Tax=Archangium sp. TaxID=1872627 RepID=UPI002ED7D6FB